MGKLNPFSKPKMPAQPKPPTVEEQRASAAEAHTAAKKRAWAQRGRGATMLGGAMGDDSSGLATKRLLGG